MIPPFEKFVKNDYRGRLICLDPGETTGYSIWDNQKLEEAGQLETFDVHLSARFLYDWIGKKSRYEQIRKDDRHLYPCYAIMEEYRVYAHKVQDHAQSTMHTSRLIGCFETLFTQWGVRYHFQGAGQAKGWAKDEMLKSWGVFQDGKTKNRHANDSIRHGCYFYHHGKEIK